MSRAERRSPPDRDSSLERWRDLARKALNGDDISVLDWRTRDGIVVEPLYARRPDAVSIAGRGARPWRIVQVVDDADPDAASQQAIEDLEGGATGLSIRFAAGAPGNGLPPSPEALRIALEGIDLATIHLRLEPHTDGISAARWLREIVETGGVAPELTDISFGLDPVAALAAAGTPVGAQDFGACVRDLSSAHFRGPFATLDGRVYHEAGATEAQELAGILAAAAWWLRTLAKAGIAPAESLPLLGAAIATTQEQLLSIAKLRALHLAWARLAELSGAPASPLRLHAETSRRMLTCADPATNLLRTTLAAFAAGVGGADSVTVLPHTSALGSPDRDARALARNIQLLLIEEAHTHRVDDPSAGSGAIEALTEALAERAWTEFQAIEREGGILASLSAGAFQARIAEARDALKAESSAGRLPLIGATVYPAPGEVSPDSPAASDDRLHGFGLAPVRLEDLAPAVTP